MNKTRYLHIVFDKNLQAYEIPKLRAAIIEKTKRESDLFHNHLQNGGFIYRYPLIQYKIKDKKPSIICLKEATDDIHYLLKERNFNFNISGKELNLEIEDVRLKYVNIQSWDKEFSYNIHNYMALNQENFQRYKELDSLIEKIQFIEDLLKKHIMIFCEEMNAFLPQDLQVKILEIKSEKYIEYKEIFNLTFSLNFKTNLFIPNYIGLGKASSVGFGIVKKLGDNHRNNKMR